MRKLLVTLTIVGVLTILIVWLWPSEAPSNSADIAAQAGAGESLSGDFADSNNSRSSNSLSGNSLSGNDLPSNDLTSSDTSAQPATKSAWVSHPELVKQKLDSEDNSILNTGFESANRQLASGKISQAIDSYRQLIDDYPMFVEPYINLAAAQAHTGDLKEARATLLQAAEANQSTKILFESLSKLHGTLAAQAYRSALETGVESSVQAKLPKILDLSTDFEYAQKIESLDKLLIAERSKQATLSANSDALVSTQKQLEDTKQTVLELEQAQKELEENLKLERQKSELAADQLAIAEKQSVDLESDLVAKLRIELANAQAALGKASAETKTLVAKNEELSRQMESVKTSVASAAVAAAQTGKPAQAPKVFDQSMKATAIELIRAWAQAWSKQDVASYLSFYQDDYSSSSNLTRDQWVDQRRIRLTNKSFIDVTVRDFLVIPTANGFSVTFTQHYRSNTLDDTIRKRMDFALDEGQAIRAAKISSEKIVRR